MFSVAYPTARSDLKKLQSHGIVTELEERDLITYYSLPIYVITYEDIEEDKKSPREGDRKQGKTRTSK